MKSTKRLANISRYRRRRSIEINLRGPGGVGAIGGAIGGASPIIGGAIGGASGAPNIGGAIGGAIGAEPQTIQQIKQ